MKLSGMANLVKMSAVKYSPEILIGFGIVGMITAGVMAVKATPKAIRLNEESKREKEEKKEEFTKADSVKACWKCYAPSIAICVISAGCIIGGTSVNVRRNAALAAAYTMSETALAEYKEKVVEVVGDKKEKQIRDQMAQEKVTEASAKGKEVIITGKGKTLCYDAISGRHFESDIDTIKLAVSELNRRLILEDYISLNEFYYEIGLKPTKGGNDLGWNIKNGEISCSYSAVLDGDIPCIYIDYSVAPRYNYHDLL